MRSIILTLLLAAAAFMSPSLVRAQGSLSGTSLGKSQNDDRDLVNSLVAPPQKFGKGEKKAQISATELKSKSIKDSTFGGSLLNMGIDPAEPKLDESKLHTSRVEVNQKPAASTEHAATTEKESAPAAKQPAAVEKQPDDATRPAQDSGVFSSLSQTATLGDSITEEDKAAADSKISSGSGDAHKDQAATGGGDKSSTATSPDPKPNGDH